jgi:hypothetical protein
MKAKRISCGADMKPTQASSPKGKPSMNMGGYMKMDKPKKLGAYGGGYVKKKKK